MTRLDLALAARSLAPSRSRAAVLIREGRVTVDGTLCRRPSEQVADTDTVEVSGTDADFVGRGGLKLEAAIAAFSPELAGLVCLDVGASTGGFTDCLLRKGAQSVFAVDVGHDQLDERLRTDERVTVIEGFNFRYAEPAQFVPAPQFAVVDVSFISLSLILPPLRAVLAQEGRAIVLVKPQFEAGAKALNKNGIVRNEADRQAAIERVRGFAGQSGFRVQGLIESPVKGGNGHGDGNMEYLMYLGEPSE